MEASGLAAEKGVEQGWYLHEIGYDIQEMKNCMLFVDPTTLKNIGAKTHADYHFWGCKDDQLWPKRQNLGLGDGFPCRKPGCPSAGQMDPGGGGWACCHACSYNLPEQHAPTCCKRKVNKGSRIIYNKPKPPMPPWHSVAKARAAEREKQRQRMMELEMEMARAPRIIMVRSHYYS